VNSRSATSTASKGPAADVVGKGRLSQITRNSKPVADLNCLNTDDHDLGDFNLIVLAQSNAAANMASDSYVDAQLLKG
jgi:hypothetical protein